MPYATTDDMIARYGEQLLIELTDRADEPLGVIDSVVINAAKDEASALIDSYVGRRYKLPVLPVPMVLRNICCTIAFYELHRGRYSDETRTAYDDALRSLSNISSGAMVLDVAGKESISAGAQVAYSQSNRQFSRQKGEW